MTVQRILRVAYNESKEFTVTKDHCSQEPVRIIKTSFLHI